MASNLIQIKLDLFQRFNFIFWLSMHQSKASGSVKVHAMPRVDMFPVLIGFVLSIQQTLAHESKTINLGAR